MGRSTTRGDSMGMKLKISLAYFQILTAFSQISSIQYSDTFNAIASATSIVDFDVSSLHIMSCATSSNYFMKVVLITIWPIVATGALIGYLNHITKCFRVQDRKIKRTEGFIKKSIILLILILYPSISRTILKGFNCISFSPTEKYLREDLNVSCMDDAYVGILSYSSLMTIIYPVGIPLSIFFYLKHQHDNGRLFLEGSTREKVLPTEDGMEQYGTLYLGYEPSLYWWEAFDMFRRFCLTSMIFVFFPGNMLQIIIAVLISFVFLQAQAVGAPYLSDFDDILQDICQLSLFFILFFGLIIAASNHDYIFWNKTGPKTTTEISLWETLATVAAITGILACLISIALWFVPEVRKKVCCNRGYKEDKKVDGAEINIEMSDTSGVEKKVTNPLFQKPSMERAFLKDGKNRSRRKSVKKKRLSVKRHLQAFRADGDVNKNIANEV